MVLVKNKKKLFIFLDVSIAICLSWDQVYFNFLSIPIPNISSIVLNNDIFTRQMKFVILLNNNLNLKAYLV